MISIRFLDTNRIKRKCEITPISSHLESLCLLRTLCASSEFSATLEMGPNFYRRDAENAEEAQRVSLWNSFVKEKQSSLVVKVPA